MKVKGTGNNKGSRTERDRELGRIKEEEKENIINEMRYKYTV